VLDGLRVKKYSQSEDKHEICDRISQFFRALLHFAHRAFWAARMRAIAAGEIRRLVRLAIEITFVPLTFAHRARWAAATRARPAADIPLPRSLPTVVSAEIALPRLSSRAERRFRSCSRCLSTETRLFMAGDCTRTGLINRGD
jgi:hypothetical protein